MEGEAEDQNLGQSTVNHQWQQVSRRRPRKPESGKAASASKESAAKQSKSGGSVGGDSVFAAVDQHSRERRAKIEAQRAWEVSQDEASAMDGDDDDEEAEEALKALSDAAHGKKPEAEGQLGQPKKQKKPRVTLVEAARGIDVEQLKAFLVATTDSYTTLPDVQLMRSADFFARAFQEVSHPGLQKLIKDSSLAKAIQYPLSDVPDPVVTVTSEWLAGRPSSSLDTFGVFLVKAAVEDFVPLAGSSAGSSAGRAAGAASIAPPKAKLGLLVLLAILARHHPDCLLRVCSTAAPTSGHQQGPQQGGQRSGQQQQQHQGVSANLLGSRECQGQEKLVGLAWVCGQAARIDLTAGMAMWVKCLLPSAVEKGKTSPTGREVALTFLESVMFHDLRKARAVLLNNALHRGERAVPPHALIAFLRSAFPSEATANKSTPRFAALFPLMKDIALCGSHRSRATRPAAAHLFPLALAAYQDVETGSLSPDAQPELCSILVWCLSQNNECYKLWEDLIVEHRSSSLKLVTHLNKGWREISTQLHPLHELRRGMQGLRAKMAVSLRNSSSPRLQLDELSALDSQCRSVIGRCSPLVSYLQTSATLLVVGAMAYGFYWLSPSRNPLKWDGLILLSRTHKFV